MNDREMLMRRLSALRFVAWELHLYLDTHPEDDEALRKMQEYEHKANEVQREYEENYGPISASADTDRWSWINDPWPWEGGEK